jgi:simple sugar transport system substrate-binding protein
MSERESKVSRRQFIGGTVGGLVVGGLAGYGAGMLTAPPQVVPGAGVTTTVTQTVTGPAPGKKIKAGFIYVGPVGDFGWSYGHDRGRKYLAKLPWLETFYAEAIPEPEVGGAIDRMVAEGADVVFTTSFGYMDPTVAAGPKYPDKYFWHCSGYKRAENVGTYFAEFYQLYYLCGLAAAGVSKTNKIGYVAAHPIPEVVRHINAFVLGAREINPKIEAYVVWLFSWFDPAKTRDAAVSLIESQNCDVLAYTEDSPTTLQVAEEYQGKGKPVWSFSHYSDMTRYGPKAHLTGQVVDWGLMYEYILAYQYAQAFRSMDLWWRLGDGGDTIDGWRASDGGVTLAPVNPAIPENVRNLIDKRRKEMNAQLFEPFTGPIKDQDGNLKLAAGQRATHDDLWTMDWFVEGVNKASRIPK